MPTSTCLFQKPLLHQSRTHWTQIQNSWPPCSPSRTRSHQFQFGRQTLLRFRTLIRKKTTPERNPCPSGAIRASARSVSEASWEIPAANVGHISKSSQFWNPLSYSVNLISVHRYYPFIRKVLKMRIWGIPLAGEPLLQLPTAQAGPRNSYRKT